MHWIPGQNWFVEQVNIIHDEMSQNHQTAIPYLEEDVENMQWHFMALLRHALSVLTDKNIMNKLRMVWFHEAYDF